MVESFTETALLCRVDGPIPTGMVWEVNWGMIERGGDCTGSAANRRLPEWLGNVSHDEKPVKTIATNDWLTCKVYKQLLRVAASLSQSPVWE